MPHILGLATDRSAMNCKVVTLLVAATIVSTSGCDRLVRRQAMSVDSARGLDNLVGDLPLFLAEKQSPAAQRFTAETHTVTVITPESDLEKSWQAFTAFCQTIQCEILSSRLITKAENVTPDGFISIRVAPQETGKLFAKIESLGKIAQHVTQRDDKTSAVVDTDAKIKNLNAFRDSLRTMLAKSSATVKDLIEIQQQLTETQSQIDGDTAQRKILANETEKIRIDVSLRIPSSVESVSVWHQLGNTIHQSGLILIDSTTALITTVVAVIPWLLVIVPAGWLIRKLWFRRRRTVSPTPNLPALS
jgi:hypothetical protein